MLQSPESRGNACPFILLKSPGQGKSSCNFVLHTAKYGVTAAQEKLGTRTRSRPMKLCAGNLPFRADPRQFRTGCSELPFWAANVLLWTTAIAGDSEPLPATPVACHRCQQCCCSESGGPENPVPLRPGDHIRRYHEPGFCAGSVPPAVVGGF